MKTRTKEMDKKKKSQPLFVREGGKEMEPVLAMVLRIEEENKVYFYLPEEKKEIGFEVDETVVAEFRDAMADEDSYFVNIDLEAEEVV